MLRVRRRRRRVVLLAAAVVTAAAAGCAGPTARALRPGDPSYARAVGEQCTAGAPQPLIVDWRPETRADLEVVMRRGVAVVAFDCHSLRLLPDCWVDGSYGFVAVTPKQERLQLAGTDEIRANLPAGVLNASLAVDRGLSLDVDLSIVGKQMSTIAVADRAALRGRCDGATHFVRAVTTGAFTLASHTRASVDAGVTPATSSGALSGTSDKQVFQQDGDAAACAAVTADAARAPERCSTPLRLDLALVTTVAAADDDSAPRPSSAGRAPGAAVDDSAGAMASSGPPVGACPLGLVWAGGACRSPANAGTGACTAHGDPDVCRRRCDAGELLACTELGMMHIEGRRLPLDRAEATRLFALACDGGEMYGCNDLGASIITGRQRREPREAARAVKLFTAACAAEPTLCVNLAVTLRDGLAGTRDRERATELFSRACLGGHDSACYDLGVAYGDGTGVVRDEHRAAELQLESCHRGFMQGCAAIGIRALYGRGVERDERRAVRFFQQACSGASELGCGLVGLSMMSGAGGLARDWDGGRRRMESACDSGAPMVCALLGVTLREHGDAAAGAVWLRKACDGGERDYCE